MNYRGMFTRGFTPDARQEFSLLKMRRGEPMELVDGHPWHTLSADDMDALGTARWLSPHMDMLAGTSGFKTRTVDGEPWRDMPVPSRLPEDFRTGQPRVPHSSWELMEVIRAVPTEFGTTLGYLREGDRIRMLWWPDAETTAELAEHGLHRDILRLEIARGHKVEKLRLLDRVARTDSIMRLVRPQPPNESRVAA